MITSLLDLVSAACTNANAICLNSLPKTAADGSTVQTIIEIAIGITAALSVLFVAIGGLRYILSQGEPQAVSKAKSTIIYALIGVAVAVSAQILVIFIANGVG